jgi:hypothetical protein
MDIPMITIETSIPFLFPPLAKIWELAGSLILGVFLRRSRSIFPENLDKKGRKWREKKSRG